MLPSCSVVNKKSKFYAPPAARYYTSRFGRWLSADWSSVPVPVPYANLTNPQTLNLYSMVSDDPESFADLDGHVQNASEGVQNTGRTCASTGQGGTGSAYSGTCGANQPESETDNAQAAEAAKEKAQAAAFVTVLGRKVKIHYGSDLSDEQKLAASDKLTKAASLLNEHADDLSDAQKKAIGKVHSIDVIGPEEGDLGIRGHNFTVSTSYLGASSVEWTASNFAHEGTHTMLNGPEYTGQNAWRSEQGAINAQIGVGRVVGMSKGEIWHLMWAGADFHKAEMQAHMTSGFRF